VVERAEAGGGSVEPADRVGHALVRWRRALAWWRRAARPRTAYALAAALGFLVYLAIFGPGYLLGTSAHWDLPLEDSRAYLMGYRYFLHEPWHWPPLVVHEMNVPYTKNIVYTDSIPAWALLNKAIATVIPPWAGFSSRAYLGTWQGLVYTMQAVTGVACVRAVGRRTHGDALVTAAFFLAFPAFVVRYGHASLSAHFLTVLALAIYLRSPSSAPMPTRLGLAAVGQLAVAALVNPYHVTMSLGLFVASVLRTRTLRSIALWLPAGLVAVGLAAGLAGFFAGEAKVVTGGFESASANLLSPFIPMRSLVFGDGRRLANVVATEYQYEGYVYLGAGLLLLLALFLPHGRAAIAAVKRHPFLALVGAGCLVYSLSNHVYFGSHRVLAYQWPAQLRWIAEQYRAPGRFVWLPIYVLVVFLLRWGLARFTVGWQALAMPALALVQVVDGGGGDWRFVRFYTQKPFPAHLDPAVWRPLVQAHGNVEVRPPYDCILDGTPSIDRVSQEVQYYASERAIPINGVYSARPTRDCALEAASWLDLRTDERTLQVLLPRVVPYVPRLQAMGAACGDFAFGVACSKRPAMAAAIASGALRVRPLPAFEPLAFGERLFQGAGGRVPSLENGWSWREPEGRWSQAAVASFGITLTGQPPPSASLRLEASAALCGEARKAANVDVLLNGVKVATEHFDERHNDVKVPRVISLPGVAELVGRPLLVELRPDDVRTPIAMGCSAEPRPLGVWLGNVWFE